MILLDKRITKALISLPGCAGWSAPVLFPNTRRQVLSRQCLFVRTHTKFSIKSLLNWLKICFLFVCFVAVRPKSTAMIMTGQQPFLNDSAEGRRMTVEIILWSISTEVWDQARIKLATPGSAVRLVSVARHVTDCATPPALKLVILTNYLLNVRDSSS